MSKSLCWSLPPIEQKENCSNLKYEIARFYDPEWNGDGVPEWRASKELIPFLQGIKSISREDYIQNECDEIISAIEKHGEIVMYIR